MIAELLISLQPVDGRCSGIVPIELPTELAIELLKSASIDSINGRFGNRCPTISVGNCSNPTASSPMITLL